MSAPQEPSRRYPVTLTFVLRGGAILSGTNAGMVSIREIGGRGATQVLDKKGDVIKAVASFSTGQQCVIALGSSLKGQGTYISVWRTGHVTLYDRLCRATPLRVLGRPHLPVRALVCGTILIALAIARAYTGQGKSLVDLVQKALYMSTRFLSEINALLDNFVRALSMVSENPGTVNI
ncbi:hypothetical protein BU15DRAFT_84274 [Melanogaster broomeanus]|nr:hypothetical protein BU15DRAFT_84274 [Melanogaster broomeanus]